MIDNREGERVPTYRAGVHYSCLHCIHRSNAEAFVVVLMVTLFLCNTRFSKTRTCSLIFPWGKFLSIFRDVFLLVS